MFYAFSPDYFHGSITHKAERNRPNHYSRQFFSQCHSSEIKIEITNSRKNMTISLFIILNRGTFQTSGMTSKGSVDRDACTLRVQRMARLTVAWCSAFPPHPLQTKLDFRVPVLQWAARCPEVKVPSADNPELSKVTSVKSRVRQI